MASSVEGPIILALCKREVASGSENGSGFCRYLSSTGGSAPADWGGGYRTIVAPCSPTLCSLLVTLPSLQDQGLPSPTSREIGP